AYVQGVEYRHWLFSKDSVTSSVLEGETGHSMFLPQDVMDWVRRGVAYFCVDFIPVIIPREEDFMSFILCFRLEPDVLPGPNCFYLYRKEFSEFEPKYRVVSPQKSHNLFSPLPVLERGVEVSRHILAQSVELATVWFFGGRARIPEKPQFFAPGGGGVFSAMLQSVVSREFKEEQGFVLPVGFGITNFSETQLGLTYEKELVVLKTPCQYTVNLVCMIPCREDRVFVPTKGVFPLRIDLSLDENEAISALEAEFRIKPYFVEFLKTGYELIRGKFFPLKTRIYSGQ
ncbi:MAG: hypothetical protein N2654_02435, partial [Deltaproteobacteria bacterium]|nr:hypothetical protein [Deltaproteobacteria bacterium]